MMNELAKQVYRLHRDQRTLNAIPDSDRKTRSTDAYVRTVYFDNQEDMEWLRNFRSMISIKNSFNRKYGLSRVWCQWQKRFVYTRIKVSANGRLGKNNPNAYKYRGRYTYRVKLEDAERADIYVHTVTDYPYA